MSKKVSIKIKPFKRANVKTFGFFLLFSALIWILVQFGKEYTQVIKIPVKYVNAPLDKSLADKPTALDLRLQEKGFVLLWDFQIFRPELTIDLSKAEVIDQQLVYVLHNHTDEIEGQLDVNLEDSNFIKDSIKIDFQPKQDKKVKVVPRLELSYAVGYSASEQVSLTPDSIKVSGPQSVIDTITEVQTQDLKINNINKDLSGKVKIDTSDLGMLSFYQTSVEYSQQVQKFTEGRLEIPVEVLNVPDNLNVVIFPKVVMVYYQVNLKDYEMVEAGDFRVVCDYNSVQPGDDYLLADVVDKPDLVTNVRLNERKIQFVIKR
ncbi:MAG: CdaR family protein [Salegentibacter sp.]